MKKMYLLCMDLSLNIVEALFLSLVIRIATAIFLNIDDCSI